MRFTPLLKLTLCSLTVLSLAGLTGCMPLQWTDPCTKALQAGSTGAEQSPIRTTEKKAEKPDLQAPLTLNRVDLLRTEVRLADLNQSRVKEQNILAVEQARESQRDDEKMVMVQAWEELLEINPIAMFGNGQSVDEVFSTTNTGMKRAKKMLNDACISPWLFPVKMI